MIRKLNEDIAGGLERVEKVKPDPLNLTANTGVGKQNNYQRQFDKGCLLNSAAPFCIGAICVNVLAHVDFPTADEILGLQSMKIHKKQ